MPENEVNEISLKLAELQRALEVGLARIDGQLALLVQRSNQTEKAVEDLEERITTLERSRWPLPAISVLSGLAATGIALWAAFGK